MLGKMQPPVLILCPPEASLGLFLHPSRGKPGPLLVYPGGAHFLSSPLSPSSPGTRPALLDCKSSAELDTPAKVTLTALIKLSPEEKLGLGRNNIGPRLHLFRRDPSRKYVRSREHENFLRDINPFPSLYEFRQNGSFFDIFGASAQRALR